MSTTQPLELCPQTVLTPGQKEGLREIYSNFVATLTEYLSDSSVTLVSIEQMLG